MSTGYLPVRVVAGHSLVGGALRTNEHDPDELNAISVRLFIGWAPELVWIRAIIGQK